MPTKLVCTSCGSRLTVVDVSCPICGASVVRTVTPPASSSEEKESHTIGRVFQQGTMPCEVCGYENPAANNFCGSCGVPLKQSAPARQKDPIAVQQTGKQKDRARVKGKREGRQQEKHTWIGNWRIVGLVVGVVVVALILAITSAKNSSSSGKPDQLGALNSQILEDIDRLRRAVESILTTWHPLCSWQTCSTMRISRIKRSATMENTLIGTKRMLTHGWIWRSATLSYLNGIRHKHAHLCLQPSSRWRKHSHTIRNIS